MLKNIKFFFALAITSLLTVLASLHQPFGSSLPALGTFLSPFTGFWQNAAPLKPLASENLRFPQLSGESQVVIDERGVPHIFASSMEDGAFIQGYLMAKDRLWQMDISVRGVAGRLSEILGERTLAHDRRQRRKGIAWAAERTLKSWQQVPEEYALLEAYCAGFNAYLEDLLPSRYPIEFKLLGYAPEPWTPLHTAFFYKAMAEDLCAREADLPATNAKMLFGEALYSFLYPEYNPKQSPIIPAGTEWKFDSLAAPAAPAYEPMMSEFIRHELLPKPSPFIGSNNWALAGSKTASGLPILANDPHLKLGLPAIWYELQIKTPAYNAYGVSLPGVPGIVIGFNEQAAWGFTNVGHDVLDWYRIVWANPEKTHYLLDGEEKETQLLVERIGVRGQEAPVLDTVRYTQWGPVTYETPGHPYQDMSMRWIAHDKLPEKPFHELGTLIRLMSASSLADYREALRGWDSPAQNFIFASRDGDIALTVNGRLPIKADQQGRFVQDGSRSENAWKGYIPYEQLPYTVNPERGFVASANQHSTAPDYPYYYNGGFDDYRGRYINRELAKLQGATVEQVKDLQLDNRSLKAEEALPLLLSLIDSTDAALLADERVQALREWDFRFEKAARAPVLFDTWADEAHRLTFDELTSLKDSIALEMPEFWRFLELLELAPEHPIFDRQSTGQVEDASDVVTEALRRALAADTGKDWSEHKGTSISHLANIAAFSRQNLDVGGYGEAPNAIKQAHGPSWRMVVQLGERPEAYGIFPGGASGNPGSFFYDVDVNPWVAGEYHRLHLMSGPEDEAVTARQRILFVGE